MKHPSDTGHFESSIAPEVVEEAVKAVERHAFESNAAEVETLKAELELSLAKGRELMGKLTDEHEKMLRALADLENYKKRAVKEKEEIQKYGSEKLVLDFLPVLDNFDRALDAAQGASDFESFRSGVEMIRRLFFDALGKHGVKSFSAKGQLFDPSRHEAMTAVETAEIPPNHVLSEVLRGFTLNERLVRPALVIIARSATAAGESGGAPGDERGKAQSQ